MLVTALFFTLAIDIWLGGNSFYIHYFLTHDIASQQRIAELADEILYLDSTISESARTLTTGDAEFDNRYIAALNIDLNKKIDTLSDESLRNMARAANKAGNRIVQLDRQYLDFLRQGKIQEADELIHGSEYSDNDKLRMDGKRELSEKIRQASHENILHLETNIYVTLFLVSMIVIILVIAWYFVLKNIHRWSRQLHHAKVTAEAASVAKSEFLANMSHELRTPLNSILGMLRLLQESRMDEEQCELVSSAFGSSTNLLDIVNDILDLSKIEAGEVELEAIGFDVQYVFHCVVVTLEQLAREKNISIVQNYESTIFPYVAGDPTRFGRILMNLISNAIKYTDAGHVDVDVQLSKSGAQSIELHCEIRDTGIGIPKEKQQAIFEKFVQADASTTRKYGGTGLGLAITKELVELMGGTIGVKSEAGKGSTFWFRIPFSITTELEQGRNQKQHRAIVGIIPPGNARILVAEDHPLNQLYIKKLLKKFAICHFTIADTGNAALELYNKSAWDIILMDCHMPGKNGYDTTEAIRRLEKERGVQIPIPIIAMTANAMMGDREKCLRCGMSDYVSKPINMDDLKVVLGQWIRFAADSAVNSDGKAQIQSEVPTVDLSQLRTFTDGDRDAEKEFIRVFIEQADKNIHELERSREQGKGDAWREAAHMFKGGAGGIGAGKLQKLCERAQNLEALTQEERQVLFEQIRNEYAKVKEELAKIL